MKAEIKRKVLKRLKIIEGQIRGLERLVGEDTYCVDVITQIEAVREALSGVRDVMLHNHLMTHVADQMKYGQKKKATEEILKVYNLSKK